MSWVSDYSSQPDARETIFRLAAAVNAQSHARFRSRIVGEDWVDRARKNNPNRSEPRSRLKQDDESLSDDG